MQKDLLVNFDTMDVATVIQTVLEGKLTIPELIKNVQQTDLGAYTDQLLDRIIEMLSPDTVSDKMITFVPIDYALPPDSSEQAYSFVHGVMHLISALEEFSLLALLLAYGINIEEINSHQLQYETPFEQIHTLSQVRDRLEECRNRCHISLKKWPAELHLDFAIALPHQAALGPQNPIGYYMIGIFHGFWHLEQLRESLRQAAQAMLV